MKKLLVVSTLILLVLFTGCGKKDNQNLDLEKIEIEVNNMTYEKDKKVVNLFEGNQSMSAETLKDKYGVDTSYFEQFLISVPTMADSASMYAIFLPVKGEENKAQIEIDRFINKYEAAWSNGYFPAEENLVKNRLEKKYSNYIIYVISNDNNAVLNKIKSVK